jgi:GDPmannose 4,6-dehydratase
VKQAGRTALIFGVGGQDGSYLAELLIGKGYSVAGTIRRSSSPNLQRLENCREDLRLLWGDVTDPTSVAEVIRKTKPDEVYNLAAMSDVGISFDLPGYSAEVTGAGAVHILEALRQLRPEARFYQAGSSEMFGMNPDVPSNEDSAFHPASPYASAKVFAHYSTLNYREARGMHASNGILFNHESPRRGHGFVTRKICHAAAAIARGGQKDPLVLGTLETSRDWGHARDYVGAMWRMLQQDEPGDYVIATGETHTVRELVETVFQAVGLDWEEWVVVDTETARPLDPPVLLGDASKAERVLGWRPRTRFHGLIEEMIEAEVFV